MTSDSIKALPFFKGMPDTLLWHLGRAVEKKSLAAGDILFRPGEPRSILAIIKSGSLAIEHAQSDGQNTVVATLGAGEVIGEGILLEDTQHGSFGRAKEPTEILFFKKAPLMKLLKDQPALYAALLSRAAKIMNARIRGANAALVGATHTGMYQVPGRSESSVRQLLDDIAALGADVGYERAIALAREAVQSNRPLKDLAREQKLGK